VTLFLGDLSLIHDLGGLALARSLSPDVARSLSPDIAPERSPDVAGPHGRGGVRQASEGGATAGTTASHAAALRLPEVAALVIVTVNNGGGRIFEQLPIGRVLGAGATFERCFATPQAVDFAHAAAAFGIPFERASSSAELAAALGRAHASHGPTLIEAVVPPHDGAARLQALWTRTAEAFAATLEAPAVTPEVPAAALEVPAAPSEAAALTLEAAAPAPEVPAAPAPEVPAAPAPEVPAAALEAAAHARENIVTPHKRKPRKDASS
jgi:hypothetical protein